MLGISLQAKENAKFLDLTLNPKEIKQAPDVKKLLKFIGKSEFKDYFVVEANLVEALATLKTALKKERKDLIVERVGEMRDAEIKFQIIEDELSVVLNVISPFGGKLPTVEEIQALANEAGIIRGLSHKRLTALHQQIVLSKPGTEFSEIVAKGLPARNGKASKLEPLIQNALERILQPQLSSGSKVDMRNLGDIICCKKGAELLRRLPPTSGRAGYTVTGGELRPKAGEWIKLRPGEGTVISDDDENLLLAEISGMPKFKDEKMWVDATYTCKGVNVGTGNVDYDGAVLVNGDVTERMSIRATGDITINGFVESATVISGGDIIITEGAMGKVNDKQTHYSTVLKAKGSIHMQHGQGLDIHCSGSVSVGRQLAHSRINCKGSVSVGPPGQANGNLFACTINSQDEIYAGTFGAISGSGLAIDFSEGFNTLLERKDTLDDLLRQLKQHNKRHGERMDKINTKFVPEEMQKRVNEAKEMFESETQLLKWLEDKALEMKTSKTEYLNRIGLVASKRIYPGVVIKLNNRTWRAERDYNRAKINFRGHQWNYEPLI